MIIRAKERCDGAETRSALLAAAAELFAKKSFLEATNAEICAKAGVNSASVNYHFGSKERLYIQAWKYAFDKSFEKYPIDGGARPDMSDVEKLRCLVLSFMKRIADPENYDLDIVHKEMASPTGLLEDTIYEAMRPFDNALEQLVASLLGDVGDAKNIALCGGSIRCQCFGPMLHRRKQSAHKTSKRFNHPMEQISIEELAEHIIDFSIMGIKGLRNKYCAEKKNS